LPSESFTDKSLAIRITAAIDAMPAFEEGGGMKLHLLAEQHWLMDQVPQGFLSESELAAMNVALASAHSRLLAAKVSVGCVPTVPGMVSTGSSLKLVR